MYQIYLSVASVKLGVAIDIFICYVLSVQGQVHLWHLLFVEEKRDYGIQK